MNRLLVTGGSGLLGSHVARAAAARHEVTALFNAHPIVILGAEVVRCDLTDGLQTRACLDGVRPEAIFHCAALTDVELCERDQPLAERANVEATATLAAWAAEHGAAFVYISTDAVFDGARGGYREDEPCAPINCYARTKMKAETVTRLQLPEALIIRTNFYGWSPQARLSLGEWILRGLSRRDRLTMFTDVYFCPILVDDLARLVLELMERKVSGTYHVVARDRCSKYEFAKRMGALFGFETRELVPISVDEYPFMAKRPKNISLDVAKVTRELGRAMPSIDEGLRAFKAALDNGEVTALKGEVPTWCAR